MIEQNFLDRCPLALQWCGYLARVGVVELFSLIVTQGDTVLIIFDHVVWVDRDFPTSAGAIDDILRDGIACGMAT